MCTFLYRLAVCEKALAEYLETKRLAFPRFYFVSSADLLDILSKGNQPVEVNSMLTYASSCKYTNQIDALPLNISCVHIYVYSETIPYIDK